MNVCYVGQWADYCGLGEAARNAIVALTKARVEVKPIRVSLTSSNVSLGQNLQLCEELEKKNKNLNVKVKIVHLTPDIFFRYLEPYHYHIGHLFWETDKIIPEWTWHINRYDEIWTGSNFSRETFIRSGVKIPIFIFPQAIDTEIKREVPLPLNAKGFVFYSIFEWIERKNPKALFDAYWREFEGEKEVSLVVKTYGQDFSAGSKKNIVEQIKSWKVALGLGNWPKVYLILSPLSSLEIIQLHSLGHCFLSAHRGEGWGIPQARALSLGNAVISTNRGGIHEWLNEDYYYPVKFKLMPVVNSHSKFYTEDQNWAEANAGHLRAQMRAVFNHQKEAQKKAKNAQRYIKRFFNYYYVGELMRKRLTEIERSI